MVAKNAKVANGKKSGDIAIDSITTARSWLDNWYGVAALVVEICNPK